MWCIKRVYCEQLVGFFIFPSKFGNPEVEEKLFYRFISFLFIMKISQCKEMITHILLLRSTIRQCKLTYCSVYCMMFYSASAFLILGLLSTITKFSYQFLQLQSSSSIPSVWTSFEITFGWRTQFLSDNLRLLNLKVISFFVITIIGFYNYRNINYFNKQRYRETATSISLFPSSRVDVRQDYRLSERKGPSQGQLVEGGGNLPLFLPSFQFPPWLAFLVLFAWFPRWGTRLASKQYTKWLSREDSHIDRPWGTHLKGTSIFEVKL